MMRRRRGGGGGGKQGEERRKRREGRRGRGRREMHTGSEVICTCKQAFQRGHS